MLLAMLSAWSCAFSVRPAHPVTAKATSSWLSPRMDLASTYVSSVAETLSKTPLGDTLPAPLFQPLAAGLALSPPAVVAAIVLKAAFESLLAPALGSLPPANGEFSLGRKLGSGSFGVVYEGVSSSGEVSAVIRSIDSNSNKIYNSDVSSKAFGFSELFMNQKLMLCGQSNCIANFQGYYFNSGRLNLQYAYEGTLTLDMAMKGKDFPFNVEESLTGRQSGDDSFELRSKLVRKIASQLFGNLAGIHYWNVVHRDIKGSNLVLAEKGRRFKLIDFGAAIDLVSKTNYDKDLQVFDPLYGPPEAPPENGGLQLSAKGKFDVYSAALVVLQMCFPAYRDSGIKRFQFTLAKQGYDLRAWREEAEGYNGFEEGFRILDQSGGFQMLEGCLQYDPNDRISSAAAASSGFCRI